MGKMKKQWLEVSPERNRDHSTYDIEVGFDKYCDYWEDGRHLERIIDTLYS